MVTKTYLHKYKIIPNPTTQRARAEKVSKQYNTLYLTALKYRRKGKTKSSSEKVRKLASEL